MSAETIEVNHPEITRPEAFTSAELGWVPWIEPAGAEELTERYGEQVDFVGWLADLELDALVTMTVGQLVDFVAGCLDGPSDGPSDGTAES